MHAGTCCSTRTVPVIDEPVPVEGVAVPAEAIPVPVGVVPEPVPVPAPVPVPVPAPIPAVPAGALEYSAVKSGWTGVTDCSGVTV